MSPDWPSPVGGKNAAPPAPKTAPPARVIGGAFSPADFVDDRTPEKMTITVYGPKDGGKTTQLYGLPRTQGPIFSIAHDRQGKTARDNAIHKAAADIIVMPAYKFYNENDPPSAQKTIDYIMALLDYAEASVHPDWIIMDAFDVQIQIAESLMRANHGLKASDSFSNLNLWKERTHVVRGIWRRAMNVARLGVGYTTYYKEKVLARVNGETSLSLKAPHWLDIIEHETVITVEVPKPVYSPITKKTMYTAIVESCKFDNPTGPLGLVFKSGETFDVTGKTIPWAERLAKFVALADAGGIKNPDQTEADAVAEALITASKPKITVTDDL
jgi:hypothetical protein